jgi:hypothetical protein
MPSSERTPTWRRQPTSTEEPLADELEQQQVFDLPAREALSIVDPTAFGVGVPLPVGRTADQPPAETEVANSDPSAA